ncbi:hypothetical protein [Anaerostipes butyraticus]|uniref:hypothetical protein n=1 Tax=Anaerostipes butyraticus TaxID=645466 RepID=UPI00320932E7
MKKTALHFGGGALGRGLTVPFLEEAGYEVVIADIDRELVEALNKERGYPLVQTDKKDKQKWIPIKKAVLFDAEDPELREALTQVEVITTSVRKENLRYVADLLDQLLSPEDRKLVLCAENVENSGTYFKQLMEHNTDNKGENLLIPDTVVDRVCSSQWPDSLEILSEEFGEFGFDQSIYPHSLGPIEAKKDLERAFVRKRLLVNTFSDASCFLGMAKGKKYLYEAVTDEETQRELTPYFGAFEKILVQKYQYTPEEVADWKKLYHKRLANPEILRDIKTVARGLWEKLKPEERFLLPITELYKMHEDIEPALTALLHMIRESCQEDTETMKKHLKETWCVNETGETIYRTAVKILEA